MPDPKLPGKPAQVVGDVIPGLMDSLGLSDRYGEEEIGRAWTQIVGEPLCLQTAPIKLKHRVLHVRVIQPTVHYVLDGMREGLLRGLQERFGKDRICELKFVLR